jgi:hypothetical protein
MINRKESCASMLTAVLIAAIAPAAPAQDATPPNLLLTQPGWEIGGQVSKYHYEEPDLFRFPSAAAQGVDKVTLKGNRVGVVAAYTGTAPNLVYSRIDGRVSYGSLKYKGSGTQEDNPDWTAEVRAVVGRDYLTGERFALSPYVGLGYRYLYSDIRGYSSTGAVGYRRYSEYWYAPIGLTMRMRAGDHWVFAPMLEYDAFIGGKQKSKLGDTGLGLSTAYNDQDRGRGYRVYLMVEGRHWSFGPWLHYWNIKDSDTAGGGLEPANWTREYGLELRYRF